MPYGPDVGGTVIDFRRAVVVGDSRMAQVGAVTNAGLNYLATQGHGDAIGTLFASAVGHAFRFVSTSNYAVYGSTTLAALTSMKQASNAATGNQAGTATANASDNSFNLNTFDSVSLINHPAGIVFVLTSVNDSNSAGYYTDPSVSMGILSTFLDNLKSKVVFLCNELPRGHNFITMELNAVSGQTVTLGSRSGLTDGSALMGVGAFNATTGAKLTKVASAPGAGQYSLSGFVFTFGDVGIASVLLTYIYKGVNAVTAYQLTMHNWLSSAAANFVDPNSSVDYHIPGALYNRPQVTSLNTWGPLISGSIAKDCTLVDSTHPSTYGEQLTLPSVVTGWNSRFGSGLPDLSGKPTLNNMQFATGDGSTVTFTATMPVSFTMPSGGLLIEAGSVYGTDLAVPGTITGVGVTGTVNYISGAISVTFSVAPVNALAIRACCDQTSITNNGLLDPAALLGTNAATGTGASGTVPKPFTAAVANFGGCLAVFSATTDDDGYPAVQIALSTSTGVIGTSPTCILSLDAIAASLSPRSVVAGKLYRMTATIKIIAGADGHLYGINGVAATLVLNTTTNTCRGGLACNVFTVKAGGLTTVGVVNQLTDVNLISGAFKNVILTPEIDTTDFTTITGSANIAVGLKTATPVSAIILISRIAIRPHSA